MKSTIVVLLVLSFSSFATAATTSTDVLVYGATPAGIAAAVSSADAGHQVLLVEPTSRVGGLLTNGLSNADFRSFESLSGFFWDFSKRVESHYREKYGAESKQLKDCFRGTHGEPSVNLKVLEAMLVERPQIRVVKQATLTSVQSSEFKGGHQRFVSATFTPDLQVKAKQFIDDSYEGDLMAMAGTRKSICPQQLLNGPSGPFFVVASLWRRCGFGMARLATGPCACCSSLVAGVLAARQ